MYIVPMPKHMCKTIDHIFTLVYEHYSVYALYLTIIQLNEPWDFCQMILRRQPHEEEDRGALQTPLQLVSSESDPQLLRRNFFV